MHRLPPAMHNSLLIMARNVRLSQERIDYIRLKAQREEKCRKDELALQANISKAGEDHIEVLFRWDKHVNGEFWTTEEQLNEELNKIKVVVAKRKTLQDKIKDYVKGFGWKEYHTTWSVKGQPHTIEYLQEHLLHIIRDSQLKQKSIAKPSA